MRHFTRRRQWSPSASKCKRKSWSLGLQPSPTGQSSTLTRPNVFSEAMDHGITHQILGFVLIWRRHLKSSAILWTQSTSGEPTSFGHVQSGKASSFESVVSTQILYPNPPDCTGEYALFLGVWEGWYSFVPVVLSLGHVLDHLGTFLNYTLLDITVGDPSSAE